jgi:hypothetical protein
MKLSAALDGGVVLPLPFRCKGVIGRDEAVGENSAAVAVVAAVGGGCGASFLGMGDKDGSRGAVVGVGLSLSPFLPFLPRAIRNKGDGSNCNIVARIITGPNWDAISHPE